MKLDLSKFKKTAEDKHTTTLESPDGHSITIMHSKLPALTREQLKRLKMAKGGKVRRYADGTPPGATVGDDQDNAAQGADTSSDQSSPDTVINVNTGGANQSGTTSPPAPQTAQQQTQPQTSSPSSIVAQYAQQPVTAQAPSVPASASRPNLNPDGTMNPGAVAQNTQDAAALQRDVNIAQGQAMGQVEAGRRQALAAIAQRDQDNFNNYILKPTQDFKAYVDANPIDPNHWAESQGTAQKAFNALGLLLGGFATNGGTGQNPALGFINNQIDRDIAAQQQRVNNQKTVLGSYQQLYGDSNVSSSLAKASLRDIYDSKAKQIALQLNTPQAWANYQAFAANQAIQKSKDLQDAAVSLPTLPGFGGFSSPGTMSSGAPNSSQTILNPGAMQTASGLRHVGYLDQAKLQQQITAADQADKVINGPKGDGVGGLHEIMQDMYEDIGRGSFTGGLEQRMKSGAASIPFIGSGLEGASNIVFQGEGYKDYNRNRAALKNDIASALAGIVAPTEVDRIVDANSPTLGDTPEDIAAKEQAIINSIKKAVPTDELEKAGLISRRRR